jgi:hypothetical protein
MPDKNSEDKRALAHRVSRGDIPVMTRDFNRFATAHAISEEFAEIIMFAMGQGILHIAASEQGNDVQVYAALQELNELAKSRGLPMERIYDGAKEMVVNGAKKAVTVSMSHPVHSAFDVKKYFNNPDNKNRHNLLLEQLWTNNLHEEKEIRQAICKPMENAYNANNGAPEKAKLPMPAGQPMSTSGNMISISN